jgi:DNA polymerase I-like protein with 3'-5' exonuclease and polymerase domains
MAKTSDLHTYYEYCARDTWGTGNSALAWLMQAPNWAKQNYLMEFPVVFPSHFVAMLGMAIDTQALEKAETEINGRIAARNRSLSRKLGVKDPECAPFNVNSYLQMQRLFKILGCEDFKSQDEKACKAASFRHPLNQIILDDVLEIRGDRKLVSTYLKTEKFYTEPLKPALRPRLLYAIDPHGTDTGRNASRESPFWCGFNIQNIPRGPVVKQIAIADDDFLFGESDLEQAESRDTAFIAGDESLIAAVTGTRDFHSVNASAFFGIPYTSIFDDARKKVLDKILRDLAKRVNHGANYNMGPDVLVDTMGIKAIKDAQRLLKLPVLWAPRKVAEYLLEQFHRTYPSLHQIYYPGVKHDITTTQMLVGATGWTRYCFGDPIGNKRNLNAYIAHGPQSLNAMVLNKAFVRVFNDLQLSPVHGRNFRLLAQIHDSILFQYRAGHEYLAHKVKELMEIPVTVRGYDGKTRTFIVPAALKLGGKYWSDLG